MKSIPYTFEIEITALAILLMISGATATTLTVDQRGGDYTKIQDAIDAASTGDIIEVKSGTYRENVNINKRLTLRGFDDGSGMPVVNSIDGNAITLSSGGSVLEGFIIARSNYGIYVISDNNVIRNNALESLGGPLYISSSKNNTLSKNNVNDEIVLSNSNNNILVENHEKRIFLDNSNGNEIRGNIGGIGLQNSGNNMLSGNLVADKILLTSSNNNTLISNNASIFLTQSSNNNNLIDNIANFNAGYENYGIYLLSSDNNSLSGNIAMYNNIGIYLDNSSYNTLRGNNASYNSGKDGYGISMYSSGNNVLNGNTAISNSNYGINLYNSSNNIVYNNFFKNSKNALDNGNNIWNITKTAGVNIIGGSWIGGNYWSDFSEKDNNGDGLAETMVPYNSDRKIIYGGDYIPLSRAFASELSIISFRPPSPVNDVAGTSRTFKITINKIMNITWYLNGMQVKLDENVKESSYTKKGEGEGTWNVTAVANNARSTDMQIWDWDISRAAVHNLNTGMDFSTIQSAIDDKKTFNGHTITVDTGRYRENVQVYKQITIRSVSGSPDVIIQASDTGIHVFNISTDNVNLSGFKVEGSSTNPRDVAGIFLMKANRSNVSNNIIMNYFYGIDLYYSENNTLEGNVVMKNRAGISLGYSNSNMIAGNEAVDNARGISLYQSNNNIISDNEATNSTEAGIVLDGSRNNMISGNNASNNPDGIFQIYSSGNVLKNNRGSVRIAYGESVFGNEILQIIIGLIVSSPN